MLKWTEGKLTKEGNGIDKVEKPFNLDNDKGHIILNFEVKASMDGYFDYEVIVSDGGKSFISLHLSI